MAGLKITDGEVATLFAKLSECDRIEYSELLRFSRFQKYSLQAAVYSLLVSGVILLIGKLAEINSAWFRVTVLSFALGSITAVLLYETVTVYQALRPTIYILKQPIASFLEGQAIQAQKDYSLSLLLSSYSPEVVKFVAKRLRTGADHLRARVSLFVGSLDKIGAIPLIAGGAVTIWKLRLELQERHAPISILQLYMCIFALVCFYVVGFLMMAIGQRIDELAEVAESAAMLASKDCKPSQEFTAK
ncbi:MAG: hypothetical protein M3Y57_08030 [Acidobacteriota bacterium]|nr:hypothetical protein [Acidobacteriota bacterium]